MVRKLLRKLILWALGDETAEVKQEEYMKIMTEWLEGEK